MKTDIRRYEDGEIIYREGDTSDSAFLVDQGQVELVKIGRSGPPVIIGTFSKGELFGETGILDKGPRSGTARADGAVTVRVIGRDDFLKAVQSDPATALRVMTRMAKRLRDTDALLADTATGKSQPATLIPQVIATVPGTSLVPAPVLAPRGRDLRPDAIIGKPLRYGILALAIAWFRRRRAAQATIQRRPRVVVITPLSAEAEFDQRPFLIEALGGIPGLEIKGSAKPVVGDEGQSNRDTTKVKIAARQLLADEKADLLIWGGEDASGRLIELRFAPAVLPGPERLGAFPPEARLVIPADFNEDWHPLLKAVMLAALGDPGDPLTSLVIDARDIGLSPPPTLGQGGQLSVTLAFAFAALLAGFGRRRADLATVAVTALKGLIPRLPRDAEAEWLAANKAVALLLESEAEKTGNVATLREAIDAFRKALEVVQKDRDPRTWAFLNARLGGVLFRLDLKTGDEGTLKEAINRYQSALQVYSRNEFPWRWAEAMNSLGQALQVYGDHLKSAAVLEKAIGILRAAAEIRTAEGAPLLYAATRNNIGSAHFLIAKHTGDPENMRMAAVAFRDALSVHRSAGGTGPLARTIAANLDRAEDLLRRSGVRAVAEPSWAAEAAPEFVLPEDLAEEAAAFEPPRMPAPAAFPVNEAPAMLGGVSESDRMAERRTIDT